MTIDLLPEVALLEIFGFYVDEACHIEAWYKLVRVCPKWRTVVYGSPRRLNLRLRCTSRTPVKETLHVWPLLPVVVLGDSHEMWGVDNIVAALEHNNRTSELALFDIPGSQMEMVLAAMRQPFPALTRLYLRPRDEAAPVDPNFFLGGSAPHLQMLNLERIPVPGLLNLLLSATHLVHLHLWRIPDSGYISPEAMVTCLSMLASLESLHIGFESPRRRPDRKSRRPPLQKRTLLPVLTQCRFRGVSEYLEDFVAQIVAPLLSKLRITFFHQLIFDTPQLKQFIGRTPKFKAHDEAHASVVFLEWGALVTLPQTYDGKLRLGILCSQSDWQLSSLVQVCNSSFPQALTPAVERLYILEDSRLSRLRWQDDVENSQWLEFLQLFAAVKDLYISQEFAPRIAPALQELVGERVTEALPALQTLFLETHPSGPIQEAIGQFAAERQFANLPIAISRWEGEKDKWYESYDD